VTVQTTTAMTGGRMRHHLDNTAFGNADEVDDDASITVECGAIKW